VICPVLESLGGKTFILGWGWCVPTLIGWGWSGLFPYLKEHFNKASWLLDFRSKRTKALTWSEGWRRWGDGDQIFWTKRAVKFEVGGNMFIRVVVYRKEERLK
jgi:hypothetical protein